MPLTGDRMETISYKLEHFEGPLDLLLHLIGFIPLLILHFA